MWSNIDKTSESPEESLSNVFLMNRNKQRLSAFYSRTKRAERGDIIVKATLTEGTTGSECCVEMSSSSAI